MYVYTRYPIFLSQKVIEYSMSKNKKMSCKCKLINVLLSGYNKKY